MALPDFHNRPLIDQFNGVIEKHAADFHPVLDFNPAAERIGPIDLSKNNPAFSEKIFSDLDLFNQFIDERRTGYKFLTGGYLEERDMYKRSKLFSNNLRMLATDADEPRSIHLGMDIWGEAGSAIFAPLGGMIESFAYNNNFGDYGATIILQHQLETVNFYSLYGHLALKDLENIRLGQFINRGQRLAQFGLPEENGHWPPHLHFQLIFDIENFDGDYPGVCKISELGHYRFNCPNPDTVLKLNRFLT